MAQTYDLDADTAATPPAASLGEDAYDRATRQARDFLSGGDRSYLAIRARQDELIAEARRELASERVAADDIEAWDTSFRAMFLLRARRPA